jgi:hypothetical protein
MPFTFSHIAIILPFCKKSKLSATGLITGAVAPDFEFLLRLKETGYGGHLWPGVLLINIPVCIALSVVFHYLVRNTLLSYLPGFLQQRFICVRAFSWIGYLQKHSITFLVCAALGIASHIFLDAFTHHDGFFVAPFPAMHKEVSFYFTLPVYFILQLLFSLAGALYIIWYVLRMPQARKPILNKKIVAFWLALVLLYTLVLSARFTFGKTDNSFYDTTIAITGAGIYALLITCCFFVTSVSRKA